jgi:solute carrier family 45 protein 1/2/4
MILAWTRELVAGFLSISGVAKDSTGTKYASIVVAVIMVYVLDFSINVIQAGIRAFVVDNTPTHQQDSANAWASRVMGMGNIIGYLFGYAELPKYLWFFGYTQFQVLCAIASIAMGVTLTITCVSISERDPRLEGTPSHQDSGVIAFLKSLYRSINRLPTQIKAICVVQFAAWIGWFPFLFYITTYVGEIYVDPIFRDNPNMTDREIDDTWEQGTRVGTFALLVFAIVTFVSSVILPWFIASASTSTSPPLRTPMTPTSANTPTGSYFLKPTVRPARRFFPPFRENALQIPGLTLKRAWLLSHFFFAGLTALTFFAHTTFTATLLVAAVGLPWAMTMWAPFALIAVEVSQRDNLRRNGHVGRPSSSHRDEDGDEEEEQQAGTVLGIHNVAVAAPQVIATLASSMIFKALQKPRGSVGDDSVAWVLRFGGLAALLAGWLTRWVREEGEAGLREVKAKF